MFSLAVSWKWRLDNPVISIERYQEEKREHCLNEEEVKRLLNMLSGQPKDNYTAHVLKFLLLTGARKGEALQAQWKHMDLEKGGWTKPAHLTKQKKMAHLPLSDQVVEF